MTIPKSTKTLSLDLERQLVCQTTENVPSLNRLKSWVNVVLDGRCLEAHICIRMIDEQESAMLNQTYRQKKGPTNILSFLYQPYPLYGDLAICVPIVRREANHFKHPLMDYWAHLVIHGTLHLLGFNHENDEQANQMETLEKQLLNQLGLMEPYR